MYNDFRWAVIQVIENNQGVQEKDINHTQEVQEKDINHINQGVQEKDVNHNNQGVQEKDINRINQGVQEKDINCKFNYDYHWYSNNSNSFCYSFNLVAFLEVDIGSDICARYPDLLTNTTPNGCVLVTKKTPVMDPTAGPIYNPRLLITPSLHLTEYYLEFQVFFKRIFHESYTMEAVDKFLQTMKTKSGYVICPGIPKLPGEIGYKPKKYREWSIPFARHDSVDCQLWHKPSHHKRSNDDPLYDSCPPCKLLWHDIGVLVQRAKQRQLATKLKHQRPSSKRPLKYMSPYSKKVRINLTRLNRKAMMKSLKHYRKHDIHLNEDQNAELLKLVSRITDVGKEQLDEVLAEADAKGKGELLRRIWKMDVDARMKYFKDQKTNGW